MKICLRAYFWSLLTCKNRFWKFWFSRGSPYGPVLKNNPPIGCSRLYQPFEDLGSWEFGSSSIFWSSLTCKSRFSKFWFLRGGGPIWSNFVKLSPFSTAITPRSTYWLYIHYICLQFVLLLSIYLDLYTYTVLYITIYLLSVKNWMAPFRLSIIISANWGPRFFRPL